LTARLFERAPNREYTRVEPEIEQLITAALLGEATPEEMERLGAYRAASPGNERAYQETVRLWSLLNRVRPPDETASIPAAKDLVDRAGIRPLMGVHPGRARAPKLGWRVVSAVAAVLLVGVGASVAWLATRAGPSLGVNEFSTGVGETATVTLLDGTVVKLGPESRLRLEGGQSSRQVAFQGRAFFAVAHDPKRKFEIRTPSGDISVLGTRFDLQAVQKDLQVAVVEGRVTLRARGSESLVGRGELGRVLDGVPLPTIEAPDADSSTKWLGNFFAFQATPLRTVVAEILRRRGSQVSIVIADSSLGDRAVTGAFDEPDYQVTMRIICAAIVADCEIRNGTFFLGKPPVRH
jgi:transmembrane sensor